MNRKIVTVLLWSLLLGVLFLALLNRGRDRRAPHGTVSAEDGATMLDAGRVAGYRIVDGALILTTLEGESYEVEGEDSQVLQRVREVGIAYDQPPVGTGLTSLLLWLVFLIALLVAVLYFLRKMRGDGGMNNIIELRKTKARPVEESDKAKFDDIGGHRDAVELLADIVDYLRSPHTWKSAGARIPRGVLLVGPPGTGKTLLARAVAGETQSAFFYTSAAEFVEMFVGVGAARVRDTFEKAAAQQPAVIFIDELDAIGRRRASGFGTMHEERENTLNQLLVLMDGTERYERLVVIAATNRPDILDPALLRSGRFDRAVKLSAPTRDERVEILKIHTRNKPLEPSLSLDRVADRTDGFTGADLEALANEAALSAIRRSRRDGQARDEPVSLADDDFQQALREMTRTNRQFDRLDAILVESVSQFAEPVGRAVARIHLTTGRTVEGEVLWMNSAHIKLRTADGSEVIVAKEMAEQIVPLEGTESASDSDFSPDRWAGKNLDVG